MAETFTIDAVKVRLIGIGEVAGRQIDAVANHTTDVKSGRNSVSVTAKCIFPGRYVTENISFRAHNIIFQYQRSSNKHGSDPSPPLEAPWDPDGKGIIIWRRPGTVQILGALPVHIHLENPRCIQLQIVAGTHAVLSARFVVRSRSAGLRVHVSEAQVADGMGVITEIGEQGTVHIGAVAPGETVCVDIPYALDQELKDIQFRSELSYTTELGDFVTGDSHTLSVNLPLGVNVQDIFQEAALFSKFSITTSTSVPLRILKCSVDDTRDFQATTPYQDPGGVPVFAKQPVSMVYRISRREACTDKKTELEARLRMHITYQCLDDEIIAAVLGRLAAAAAVSDPVIMQHLPLLTRHLRYTLSERLARLDLTIVGLLREAQLREYDVYGWDRCLAGIDSRKRSTIQSWLEKWHAAISVIPLDPLPVTTSDEKICDSSRAPLRQITIPVDVPPMPILHTARLTLASFPTSAPPHIGTPCAATLSIRHTRAWSQSASLSSAETKRPLKFVYELDVLPDTWLLGGPRKRSFIAKDGEEVTFELLLIPLKAGRLLLPGLDVSFAEQQPSEANETVKKVGRNRNQGGPNAEGSDDAPPSVSNDNHDDDDDDDNDKHDGNNEDDGNDDDQPICEVDYLSQGVTVLVVPGVRRISIGLGFGDGAGTGESAMGREDSDVGANVNHATFGGPARRMGFGTSWVLATEGYSE